MPTTQEQLRARLLTQALLPAGFKLNAAPVNLTTTGRPPLPHDGTPLASIACPDLMVVNFMTGHEHPVQDVAVAVEREGAGGDDYGWYGQEVIDRYGPGEATRVMATIRAAAERCRHFSSDMSGGGTTTNDLVVSENHFGGDEGFTLTFTSVFDDHPDDGAYIFQTGYIRVGDVILSVSKTPDGKPAAGVEAILPAAWNAYRSVPG